MISRGTKVYVGVFQFRFRARGTLHTARQLIMLRIEAQCSRRIILRDMGAELYLLSLGFLLQICTFLMVKHTLSCRLQHEVKLLMQLIFGLQQTSRTYNLELA